MKSIPIYTKSARKGTILAGRMMHLGDIRILVKKVDSKKHKMKLFDGYGIQDDVYRGYLKELDGFVMFVETDTGMYLVSYMKDWVEKGVSRTFNEDDGNQRFLSTKYMADLENEDAAISYIKTIYYPRPVKKTKLVKLA